jgi:excinuclease ABC subunit C
MTLDDLKKKNLPDEPGVYFFKYGSKILYIGRATSLRDRVKSYFSNDVIATRGPRIVDMVTRVDSVEWEKTDSVLESIILEANLIKKHLPDYNVKEKDDKSFNYVVITKESFPRILIVRGRNLKIENSNLKISSQYGPFTSTSVLRNALHIIRKMFPFLDEKSLSKDTYRFYKQLGLTPDTASPEARKVYMSHIRHIKLFLSGKKNEVIKSLHREMRAYAKSREFEKANEVKRRIFALEHIQDVALIKDTVNQQLTTNNNEQDFRIEAYDVAHMSGKESVAVMTVVINGEIDKSQYRKFKLSKEIGNNDVKSLEEVLLRRFKHSEWKYPDLVVVDGGMIQKNKAEEIINKLGIKTTVVSFVKDDKHKAKGILGLEETKKYKKDILLANLEAHRFAISYYRKLSRMSHRRLGDLFR